MGYRGHRVTNGPHHNHNHSQNDFNKSLMDQQLMMGEQTICFCHRFLNPLGNYFGNGLVSSCLQHYCRVCNIQLNSCRQAKIHSEGKKHEKRLAYLRLCLESTGDIPMSIQSSCPPPGLPPPSLSQTSASLVPTSMASSLVPPPVPPPQAALQASLPPPPTQMPPVTSTAIYSYQPTVTTYQQVTPTMGPPPMPPLQAPPPPTTYYYPQTTYHSLPPQQQQQATYQTSYPEYITSGMQPPPPIQSLPPMLPQVSTTTLMSIAPPTLMVQSGHPGMLPQQQQQQQQHGVMSPSLTSGFSGSGDCKSTETSSILSAASYSSVGAVATVVPDSGYNSKKGYSGYGIDIQDNYYYNHHNYYGGGHVSNTTPHSGNTTTGGAYVNNSAGGVQTSSPSQVMQSSFCDVCQMAFPSSTVLENHMKGSRHARKVKSQQAFRQLKETGTHFRQDDIPGGEIRCEVCQVSVNSSQQLQAHLTGHKHRVRAVRRGVKPNQALLSPSSSTASTSEHSFVTNYHHHHNNNNNNNNVKSGNNKYLSNATGSSSNTVVAEPAQAMTQQQLNRPRRTFTGVPLSRHRSSGCLSRHCHSTLSLSRAKSSSALNKVRSRSMNLLMVQPDTSSSTSTSSDESDGKRIRSMAASKRRPHHQVNGRPRSFSARTASITKDDESKAKKELASPKVDPPTSCNGSKKNGSENGRRNHQNHQNQLDQHCNKHHLNHIHHNNNNNNFKNNNKNNNSSKTPRTIVPEWKPRRTSVGNALKEVPMLDMFLERLNPGFNKGRSTHNSNSKVETNEEILP